MCSCRSTTDQAPQTETAGRDYAVSGMTCGSCAAKVTRAVEQVAGVTAAHADPAAGRLTVSGTASDEDIRRAVTGAGYQITEL